MAAILQKRRSLHKDIKLGQSKNAQLESQLAQLQSLANIGTITAMIAHEINNILTPLSNFAQLAINNPTDVNLGRKSLEKTVLNAGRAAKILEGLSKMVNGEKENKVDTSLKELVEVIFTCLCRDFGKDKISLDIQIPSNITINAVPVQIQQVIMNLILNARDAMLEKGGKLSIRAFQNSQSVGFEVSDTGCGIAESDIERIFEPFYTTKNRKAADSGAKNYGGTGLGLAFCRYVIEAHNGNISVHSQPQKGTSFIVTLPKNS